MKHNLLKGTKVRIIELQPYDIEFHPELKVGDIGTVIGPNDYIDEVVSVDFNGAFYNMEVTQLEEVKDEH